METQRAVRKPIRAFRLCLVLVVCGCSSADDPVATNQAGDTKTTDELSTLEQRVHQQINEYRQAQNLEALQWNETLADTCRSHSLDMASGTVPVGHQGFDSRVAAIGQTVPYTSAAENVAYNNLQDPATTAVQSWLTSPGHLENIQGEFDLTGVGVARSDEGTYFFTQIFVRQ